MDKSSWPIVSKNEIKVINQVLASNNLNYWTGKNCTKFEKIFLNYLISNILSR